MHPRPFVAIACSASLLLAGLALAPWVIGPRAATAQPTPAAPGVPRQPPDRPTSLLRCLGDTRSLIISSGMPYTPVRVQGFTGFFVVDLGADGSAISPTTFLTGRGPEPLPGSVDLFAGFDFFGPWAPVRLRVQDQSGIQGPLRQAGLIGTDLISDHVLTLDYANGLLHRSSRSGFCGDAQLRRAGFLSLSSRDYYSQDVANLSCPAAPRGGSCPNIPTIPLRIGQVHAVAQVDTGYDDGLHAPSLNINQALLERIQVSGLRLVRLPAADLRLSSCVPGQQETVLAYQLPTEGRVELLGSEAQVVRRLNGVTLFLKNSPPAIQRCGGIGTWRHPAAQLGASFVNDGTLVVDPFSQRLWFRGPLERGAGAPEDAHGAPR